jgi:hypothetical protein
MGLEEDAEAIASSLTELAANARTLAAEAEGKDQELADALDKLAEYELVYGVDEPSCDAAWWAAEALHREAHDRWQLAFCAQPSCVALKDALCPDWRVSFPSRAG